MKQLLAWALAVIVTGMGSSAPARAAQSHDAEFPARPVRWIVPFAAGGAADILSRAVAQKLIERWGQNIVVDFRPGAAGNVGTEIAARATADGYTVVLVPATFTTTPSLYARPPFDPLRDFVPISLLSSSPLILVVHPSLPANSVATLVAYLRKNPGAVSYASSGVGASAHLAGELFRSMAKVDIVHVPYRGQAPALLDLLSGRVQMMFSNAPSSLPHVRAGRLRSLAATSLKRTPLLPDLPTMAESGLPGFEAAQWSGLVAPAGTPGTIIAKYHGGIVRALGERDVRERLVKQGFEPIGNTPQQFAAYLRSEIAKWARVIKQAGIRAD